MGKAFADVPQAPCGLTGSPGSTQLAAISSKGFGKTPSLAATLMGLTGSWAEHFSRWCLVVEAQGPKVRVPEEDALVAWLW